MRQLVRMRNKKRKKILYARYFWHDHERMKTDRVFDNPMPKPENVFQPVPKSYCFSTRNLSYGLGITSYQHDQYPYLFDHSEMALGHYIYPRFYIKETDKYGRHTLEKIHNKQWGLPHNIGNRTGVNPIEFTTKIIIDNIIVNLGKAVNINSWRYYPPRQCPTGMIIGKMGEGKSILEHYLLNICLDKEKAIVATDNFLECQNLAMTGQLYAVAESKKKFKLPEDYRMNRKKINFTKFVVMTPVEVWYLKGSQFDFENKFVINRPNITFHEFTTSKEVFNNLQVGKVVAVYDENLTRESRAKFWYEIAVMLNRRRNNRIAVIIAHHEASFLLPSHPTSGKFEEVQNFADEYVHFRKANVRVIFAQQLLKEGYWRTNQKTAYIFYKQNDRNDALQDWKKASAITQLAKDEMILENAGSYSLHNSPLLPYSPIQAKMIKLNDLEYGFKEVVEEVEQLDKRTLEDFQIITEYLQEVSINGGKVKSKDLQLRLGYEYQKMNKIIGMLNRRTGIIEELGIDI